MRGNRHYVHLAIMTALSFISMYILMYAMVNRFANVYSNLNQFYMAGLMTASIVVLELASRSWLFFCSCSNPRLTYLTTPQAPPPTAFPTPGPPVITSTLAISASRIAAT